ncbi:protein synthesis inhibitor II-like [Triticum dicoccoides]|uniref:protein synthesis inhibitor II-like n=1 Tax=Triticum dicoccoides TaxID=85692 RepID=UPI00189086CF|nr:protein synthesis inhibitor II-like [Triticum dicoccoides]
MAAKMAKNVDKPLFTATFNIQSSSADYVTFITGIRNKLRNPGQSSHNRPVLPPIEPNVPPSRWFHIVLKTSPANTGLTLATRADNLYWEGFKSSDGTWWELTPGLIPGATYVGFGGTYRDLLGDTDKLTNVALGRQQMADAVTALYGRTKADKTSGPKQQQAREAVTTLLLMVHEATRFQTVSGFVAGLLHPKTVEKKSGKISNELKAQVNGWQDLSEALLKTDAKPPAGKPPAKFTPVEKMGVRTAEQAAATLGILLFVQVPGGMTVPQALELFHKSGGK